MRKLVAFALLATTGLAVAQTQASKPPPQEDPPPRLNLKLDQPARFYTTETPGEKKPSDDKLPSLGDGARPMERPAPTRGESTFSYPEDIQRK